MAAIKVSAQVRYWEDAQVGDTVDEDGSKIPLRNGDYWEPVIDLKAGRIRNWPEGYEYHANEALSLESA